MLTLNLNPFPELETERLYLRRITYDDAERMLALRSNPAVMRYIPRPFAKNLDDAKKLIDGYDELINNNTGIVWAIVLKSENKFIGNISFWKNDLANFRAELGYMLDDNYWRKGIMYEALFKLLDFGFNELKFNSIIGITDPENTASQAVMKKAGLKQEAHFREDFYFQEKFLDSVQLSILAKDWHVAKAYN